jgi:hypothetical protein
MMGRELAMRGEDRRTGQLFSYVDLESRGRAEHPLRAIRDLVTAALAPFGRLRRALFARWPAEHRAGAAVARRCCSRFLSLMAVAPSRGARS